MSRICTWIAVLTVFLLLSGCRTYGGYGAEAAIYNQIERVLERFDEHLSRTRAELRALEAASSDDPTLAVLSTQYAELVAAHEAMLEKQRRMASRLSPNSTYRTLHRTYGSMVTEQSLLRDQYQGILRNVFEAHSPDTTMAADRDRPYALIPPYYARAANAHDELNVNAVIARVRSAAGRSEGLRMVLSDTTSGADRAPGDGEGSVDGP